MKYKAIVAYSFGGSVGRPGPSNLVFGNIINHLLTEREKYILAIQDFIESCTDHKPDLVVGEAGKYISTKKITDELAPFLKERGVTKVLLVAHPFLHWKKCKRLLEAHGFGVRRVRTGWVPFDPACENWWVRSPFHLFLYGLLQLVFGRQGH